MANLEAQEVYFSTSDFQLGKADRRRLSIIEECIRLIARHGISGVNFENLARSLEVRRSHIAYYFKTQEELIMKVVRFVSSFAQEQTVHLSRASEDPYDRIYAINAANFRWAKENPAHAKVLISFFAASTSNKKYRKLNSELRIIGLQRIHGLLKLAKHKGSNEELMAISKNIHSLTAGILIDAIATDMDLPYERIAKTGIEILLGQKRRAKKSLA